MGKPEGGDHVKDIDVYGRIILKWVVLKWDWYAWTALIWLRIVTGGGHL